MPPLWEGGVPESAGSRALIKDGPCQTLHQAAKLHSPHLLGPRATGPSFLLKIAHTPELQLPLPRTNPSRISLGAWAQPQPRQTEEAAKGKGVSHPRGRGCPRTCEKLWATITRWTRGQRASLVGVGLHQLHLEQTPAAPQSCFALWG